MSTQTNNIRIEKQPWVIVFLLLTSTVGLAINGYRYGFNDHAFYIPMIDRLVNPDLFPEDYLFDEPSGEYNFWIPAMAMLARFFPLNWIFFLGYILTRFALFWAIYHLSINLFNSRGAAVLAVLFLVIPKSVGGTATATQDIFFTLRSTAMPLAVAFLIPYFQGRITLAAIICGVVFLIHPITAIPLICLLGFRLLIEIFRQGWRIPAKAFVVFTACILPLVIRVFLIDRANHSDLSPFSQSNLQWLEIIKERDSYIFISVWNREAFLSLVAYTVILLVILLYRHKGQSGNHANTNNEIFSQTDFWAFGVVFICAGLFCFGSVFVEWYPLPLIVQLQVLRGLHLIVNLSMIYAAWLLWEGFQHYQKFRPSISSLPSQPINQPIKFHSVLRVASQRTSELASALIVALTASLFVSRSYHQLTLGSITLVCWWTCFHFADLSFVSRRRAFFTWISLTAGSIIWLSVIWAFRRFFAEALNWHVFWLVLAGLISIELVGLLTQFWKRRRAENFTAGGIIFTTILTLLMLNSNKLDQILIKGQLTHHVNLPGKCPPSNWVDVGQWCKTHTSVETTFFVPPKTKGFRIHSRRSSVGDWKAGAPCVFSARYAKTWWSRMGELSDYQSFNESRFQQLREKYGASLAVVRKEHQLNFPILYQNHEFTVYKLGKQ